MLIALNSRVQKEYSASARLYSIQRAITGHDGYRVLQCSALTHSRDCPLSKKPANGGRRIFTIQAKLTIASRNGLQDSSGGKFLILISSMLKVRIVEHGILSWCEILSWCDRAEKQSLFQKYKNRICYVKLNFLHKKWPWILEFLPERRVF